MSINDGSNSSDVCRDYRHEGDSSVAGTKEGSGLYCTGVGEILEHGRFFDPSGKQLDQLAVHSDIDGCVRQDLAVAVPAAVGGSTATSRVVSANLTEDLSLAGLPQIQLQIRVALAVTRCEAEAANPLDLDERHVELVVFAGVSEEVSEEVKAGTLSHQDEVRGAVSQVSSR